MRTKSFYSAGNQITGQHIITADTKTYNTSVLVFNPEVGQRVKLPCAWALCEPGTNKKQLRNGTIIKVYPNYFMVEYDKTKIKECFCYVSTKMASYAKALKECKRDTARSK